MNTGEVQGQVAGLAELLRHVGRRLDDLLVEYLADLNEDDQLENPATMTNRTKIRRQLESTRDDLARVESDLREVESFRQRSSAHPSSGGSIRDVRRRI